ncbi:uncharacterized protein LOC113291028 [Papaver somniferum]|uniref:uncharacterized protein LOC113291028 n=1 Tax=Papaver somniferum TaxID=3469 RepID=UPI000E6FCF93|nr:uncharacterized protein LOC113291028 [Papaver somniferum]
MVSDKKSLHPGFAVSNIKTLIPINLDIKQDEYSSWVFLFQLHLQAHNLLFLIDDSIPPPDLDASTILQLDALCRQWMFSTMTKDLMLTVLRTGNTAKELWDHVKRLFQDNKGSHAANLESKFVNLKFFDCNNVDDYCDKLHALSNRLSDLDFPMDEKRLVIQLVNGLPKEYNTVVSFIQQLMPSFDTARSQLRTEDIRRENLSNSGSHTALAAANSRRPPPPAPSSPRSSATEQHRFSLGRQAPLLPTPAGPRHPYPTTPTWASHWSTPPSPYPTTPGYHSTDPYWASQQHFVGRGRGRSRSTITARSPQAYITPTMECLHPSDISEEYNSMIIRTPDDDFYMDTGATSHITSDPGLELEEDYSTM